MPNVFVTTEKVKICHVTYIPNAYDAIMQAVKKGDILFTPYEDNSSDKLAKIHRMIQKEYQQAEQHPEYRYFLKHHFQINWAG